MQMLSPPPFRARVAVVIPAFNEETSLPLVLRAIPRDRVDKVVVVDNGSTDNTSAVARALGSTVIVEVRRGYGAACQAGLNHLRGDPPEIVVFLDADFSDHPEEMPDLLAPILEDGCDLVVGSRLRGRAEPGALLLQARWGNRLATYLLRWLYGTRSTDLGPFRAARYERLMELGMSDPDFGWTVEMQAKAALAGWKTAEVPVSYRRRIGVSKITGTLLGSVRAGVKILYTLFRIRFLDR
ncbi:MAG TPA: glycosyltransferase family 2 protein [Candidatus Polarisedimenticolia bacterium]|nr:glycosyltransferase family 2 protein [Candidatus Polarisedimenticolia bacterium]